MKKHKIISNKENTIDLKENNDYVRKLLQDPVPNELPGIDNIRLAIAYLKAQGLKCILHELENAALSKQREIINEQKELLCR